MSFSSFVTALMMHSGAEASLPPPNLASVDLHRGANPIVRQEQDPWAVALSSCINPADWDSLSQSFPLGMQIPDGDTLSFGNLVDPRSPTLGMQDVAVRINVNSNAANSFEFFMHYDSYPPDDIIDYTVKVLGQTCAKWDMSALVPLTFYAFAGTALGSCPSPQLPPSGCYSFSGEGVGGSLSGLPRGGVFKFSAVDRDADDTTHVFKKVTVFVRKPVTVDVPHDNPGIFLSCAPNPLQRGQSARIDFALDSEGPLELSIHDVNGRRVRGLENTTLAPGRYSRSWDGRDDHGQQLPSGVYFIRQRHSDGDHFSRLVLLH